jgi:acyl dehydratase
MPRLEQIAVGQQLPPFVADADAQRMKTVAALLNDPVPLHFDVAAVEALGYGNRVINQGPITVSFLLESVSRFAGGHHNLRRFEVRLLGSVYAGEQVHCGGSVIAVDPEGPSAELELEARVAERPVLAASATIQLED